MNVEECLAHVGLSGEVSAVHSGGASWLGTGAPLLKQSPIDGSELCQLSMASPGQLSNVLTRAREAFYGFRDLPAPLRGQFVREFGNVLRSEKELLAEMVTLEVGKIRQESLGEVQEMIDICDFAAGLSRSLEGKVFASERAKHRLTEQWHPLGVVGVISAFNFPVAVWAWNAALAWVCGDPVVWKPSEKAPLSALLCHQLALRAQAAVGLSELALSSVVIGGKDVGEALADANAVALVSATGSVAMGRRVGERVARRLGRSLLELGGNNAAIVTASADLELAVRGVVFAAVGTAGQRCTTLRRLIVHESVYGAFVSRLRDLFARLPIGDPRQPQTLVGPLIDAPAFHAMQATLDEARAHGANVSGGQRVQQGVPSHGYYVQPALVEIDPAAPVVQRETFAPILYVHSYQTFEQAIELNNSVTQGLSSAVFTNDLREAERFCSAAGSDCGIANVNIGTSGAEIGGAFGGEKDTGGGRESGSDSWKAYMRRATNTINFGDALPLAQGIVFDVPTKDP